MLNSSVLDVALGLFSFNLMLGTHVYYGKRVARAAFQHSRR